MPGGVVLAGLDRPMCAKLLSAAGPAEASSEVCASLRRGLEADRRAGRCGGCDSAAQAATSAQSTSARMPPPTPSNWKLVECDAGDYLRGEHRDTGQKMEESAACWMLDALQSRAQQPEAL